MAVLPDAAPQFDTTDQSGTTTQFSGTVGTSVISLPASAGALIDEVVIQCSTDQLISNRLSVSFDGGTNYTKLVPGQAIYWEPRGQTQVKLLGNVAGVLYEVTMNRGQN
jgi:hypothetical protein